MCDGAASASYMLEHAHEFDRSICQWVQGPGEVYADEGAASRQALHTDTGSGKRRSSAEQPQSSAIHSGEHASFPKLTPARSDNSAWSASTACRSWQPVTRQHSWDSPTSASVPPAVKKARRAER